MQIFSRFSSIQRCTLLMLLLAGQTACIALAPAALNARVKVLQQVTGTPVDQLEWNRVRKAYGEADSAGKYPEMIAYARQLVKIAGTDANALSRAHNNLGLALYLQGKSEAGQKRDSRPHCQEAIQEFANALALLDRITDRDLQNAIRIRCNAGKGDVHHFLGESALAELHWERGIEAAKDANDTAVLPILLNDVGSLLADMRQIAIVRERMAAYFTEQRKAFVQKNMLESVAWCDYWLAFTYNPPQAIETLKAVIAGAAAFDPKLESEFAAVARHYLGLLDNEEGRFEEAARICGEADAIWQKRLQHDVTDRAESQAECRNNRARALLNLGDFQGAVKEFERALLLKPSAPGYSAWNVIENNRKIALLFAESSVQEVSLDNLLPLIQGAGDAAPRAAMALRFGEELEGQGRPEIARRVFMAGQSALQKEMTLSPARQDSNSALVKRLFLGALLLKNGSPKEAAAALEQAREDMERTQNEGLLVFCLPTLAVAEESAGRDAKAEETYRTAVTRFESRLARVSSPERLGLFQVIHANTLYADYANFLARSHRPAEALLMADRPRSRGVARQAENLLAASSAAADEVKARQRLWKEPLSLQELQTLAYAHPDTLFLHYNICKKGLILFACGGRTEMRHFALGTDYPALLGKMKQWRQNLSANGSFFAEETLARELGKILLGPLYTAGVLSPEGKAMRWRHLVLIPDGGLYNIPFAALILPEPGKRRLIERLPLSVTASLRQLIRKLPLRKPKGKMLVINDPTGGPDSGAGKAAPTLGATEDPPLGDYRRIFERIALKYVGGVKFLTGIQAQEEETLRLLPDYAVLVFATHGHALESEEGLASYLTLAPDRKGGKNGALKASRIMMQTLSARLALLIACETGQGRLSGGEGNQGLVWAFRAAGCPSVVASLWPVDTASASHLFPFFLEGLRQGLSKDVALQKAILTLCKTTREAGKWAAFQVYGDVNPIQELIPIPPSSRVLTTPSSK